MCANLNPFILCNPRDTVCTVSHSGVACRLLGIISGQVGDLLGIVALYHTCTHTLLYSLRSIIFV